MYTRWLKKRNKKRKYKYIAKRRSSNSKNGANNRIHVRATILKLHGTKDKPTCQYTSSHRTKVSE